jgi:hypothetical protein
LFALFWWRYIIEYNRIAKRVIFRIDHYNRPHARNEVFTRWFGAILLAAFGVAMASGGFVLLSR